jgi:NADH-quinone oxidoreductase subunit L
LLGTVFWRGGDVGVIDGIIISGATKTVGLISNITRLFQTGYVYHYAFTMIFGLLVLLALWVRPV